MDDENRQTVQVNESPIYSIGRLLGYSGSGRVQLGRRIDGHGNETALSKVCLKFVSTRHWWSDYEAQVYEELGENIQGLQKLHYHGVFNDRYVMIMDVLGSNLIELWKSQNYTEKIDAGVVRFIAAEALSILQKLHVKGFIHGDVCPENMWLEDRTSQGQVKLFLTGLEGAGRWRERETEKHVEYDQTHSNRSRTIRYGSVHALLGRTMSRRDDIETLGYSLIHLIKGILPWQGYHGSDIVYKVCKKKMNTSLKTLCYSCPRPFQEFLEHAINLGFDEEPDYTKFINLFRGIPHGFAVQLRHDVGERNKNMNGDIIEDENGDIEISKRRRRGKQATQWIVVYNAWRPTKQRLFKDVSCSKVAEVIEKGCEDGLLVSGLTSYSNKWTVIMDRRNSYTSQVYEISPISLHKEWIMEQWERRYYITDLAGSKDGSSTVIMSRGTKYTHQTYKVSDLFPIEWVKQRWQKGYFVTSMSSTGGRWMVVMSLNAAFEKQVVEMDFAYPSEGIRKRWEMGYVVTCIAASFDQVVVMMSVPRMKCSKYEKQCISRTSEFPKSNIKEKWGRNLYVFALCYGRTQ